MKLHLSILEKLIELPTKDPKELRPVLDDLGLEVKGVEGEGPQTIFTIETLANRGDHLCALGAAREFSARYLTPISYPAMASELTDRKTSMPVRNSTEKCLRYALLEMSLPKPMELRADIAAIMTAGTESSEKKHAIVDLLNYIQLELGQPMHAFDRDKVEGEVAVEISESAQEIVALDDKTYKIPAKSIVIRDKKKIIAVAGVIGCKNTMVTADTTNVVIESATFDPVSVRLTARAMGLSTDASYAFERGSDREAVLASLKRLVALAKGAGGAAHVLGFTDLAGTPPEKIKVPLRLSNLRAQMSLSRLTDVEVSSRLKNLGFGMEALPAEKNSPAEWKVTVPSWRAWDIRNEEDLTEEFARAYGLNKVKLELPPLDYQIPEASPLDTFLQRIEASVVGNGFIEVMSKVFCNADDVALLEGLSPGIGEKHLTIKNSVERSYSHLKLTNILHLARLSADNHRRGVLSFKAWEFGRLFALGLSDADFEFERDVLTMAASGRWTEHEWQKPETTEELLFLFKGVVENVIRSLGIKNAVSTASKDPFLHPGCQTEIKVGRDSVGRFGLIHPLFKTRLDLRHDVLYAELDAAKLIKSMRLNQYQAPSDFPSIRRDITLKLEPTSQAGKVSRAIHEGKVDHLTDVAIVDNFRKSEENFRRVTYRLTFQSTQRTLESAEVDRAMEGIVALLKSELNIERA